MRRFLLLMVMLAILLLVGRNVSSAGELQDQDSPRWTSERGDDWKEDGEDRDSQSRKLRVRTGPRVRDGRVRFRLADRGYDHVALSGSFNDWRELPMSYDERRDIWEIEVEVGRGSHRYVYVVEQEGKTRRRRDPSNSRRTRDDDDRWVSELVIGKKGRLVRDGDDFGVDFADEVFASYQRVDGFSLGVVPELRSQTVYAPSATGKLGYGFASERWSARLDLEQPLVPGEELQAILRLFDTTDFTDQTGVGDVENTLTSLVVREDHRDYYRREGLALGLTWQPVRRLRFLAEIQSEDQSSLARATRGGWGGREMLMLNPAIEEGTLRSLVVRGRVGTELRHAWIHWEYANNDFLSTKFNFSRLTAQYRTRFRMGRYHYLDLRLKGGKNFVGSLPPQKRYVLGGIGTIRGHQYQSVLQTDQEPVFTDEGVPIARGGQQMILANAEYLIGVDHDLQLVVLFDTGLAAEDRNADLSLDNWKSSVGIGVQFEEESFRINVVRPLDTGNDDFMVQARFNRMF